MSASPVQSRQAPAPGALVIGGDYRGLGVVRSLGRRGIPVWVMHDQHALARFSRYNRRSLPWPDASEEAQVAYLIATAQKYGLEDWTIFPSGDETTALAARYSAQLSRFYQLTTPPWTVIELLTDKRKLYELALKVGVPAPWTCHHLQKSELAELELAYPVILKPAERAGFNPLVRDKAWKVHNNAELIEKFEQASAYIAPEMIMIQEYIPGGGAEQYSYAALYQAGQPLAEVTARRGRQYPPDFGRFSTYVESIAAPAVAELSRRVLAELAYTGLIELEYKRDPLTGAYKLLDANPRVWGWHTLGRQQGLDFAYLQWQMVQGQAVEPQCGAAGLRWVRLGPDLMVAAQLLRQHAITPGAYLQSLRGLVEYAIFAGDDPLPALVDLPLSMLMVANRRML